MRHPLEDEFNASAWDILSSIQRGFRAQVDVKGKLAEYFLNQKLEGLVAEGVLERCLWQDKDGEPDFIVTYRGKTLRIECKNVRSKELFKEPPAYKVEIQKTRNAIGGGPTRGYRADEFDVLAACLFNHTHAEWVNVRKLRVKDSVECLWWLSKTPWPKANNQRVLQEYSPDMLRLIRKGYKAKKRPSGHNITAKFTEREGSIPPNFLMFGNNDANGRYLEACKRLGYQPHPARFPIQLPTFFIRFLTDPGDQVLDPFAGSNTTGEAAEREGRNWIAIESRLDYLEASQSRFEEDGLDQIVLFPPREEVTTPSSEDDMLLPGY